MKLASRFGRVHQIRRDRPLTNDELMAHVPSVFGTAKHESRSDRYALNHPECRTIMHIID